MARLDHLASLRSGRQARTATVCTWIGAAEPRWVHEGVDAACRQGGDCRAGPGTAPHLEPCRGWSAGSIRLAIAARTSRWGRWPLSGRTSTQRTCSRAAPPLKNQPAAEPSPDDDLRRLQPVGQLEQHPPNTDVQLQRVDLGQAAGVGQDEAGRPRLRETGRQLARVEHGDHLDAIDRLGSRGVIVQDRDPPAGVGQGPTDPPPGIRLHPRRGRIRRVRSRHRRQETWRPPLMS